MKQYKSHKIVEAAKIGDIDILADGGALLIFDDDVESISVDNAYLEKHLPEIGGYFVQYDGGYASFSPADSFEFGYTEFDPDAVVEPPSTPETVVEGMFEWALIELRAGATVQRKRYPMEEITMGVNAFVVESTARGMEMWIPAVEDILAEDWVEVDKD